MKQAFPCIWRQNMLASPSRLSSEKPLSETPMLLKGALLGWVPSPAFLLGTKNVSPSTSAAREDTDADGGITASPIVQSEAGKSPRVAGRSNTPPSAWGGGAPLQGSVTEWALVQGHPPCRYQRVASVGDPGQQPSCLSAAHAAARPPRKPPGGNRKNQK